MWECNFSCIAGLTCVWKYVYVRITLTYLSIYLYESLYYISHSLYMYACLWVYSCSCVCMRLPRVHIPVLHITNVAQYIKLEKNLTIQWLNPKYFYIFQSQIHVFNVWRWVFALEIYKRLSFAISALYESSLIPFIILSLY